MADKPTTPDPAGGRRRKRPAPTIDLTATEVPPDKPAAQSSEQTDRPSQEHTAEAQTKAAREPEAGQDLDHDGSSEDRPFFGRRFWRAVRAPR